MVYTDLLFVFGLLPVYIAFVFGLRENYEKNFVALMASVAFLIWGRPLYYALVPADVCLVYVAGRFSGTPYYKTVKSLIAAVVSVSVLPLIIGTASENSIRGAAASLGFAVFALRSWLYLKYAENGGEKNLLNLAIYLISFEFMAVSPVLSYSDIKDDIAHRKNSLAMLAAGTERFVAGLAGVTVLGYFLERIRIAALFSGAVPYLNAIIGLLAGGLEIYVCICGYLSMSEGLCLMSGYRIRMWDSSFTPRSLMKNHLGYAYLTLSAELNAVFAKTDALVLMVLLIADCIFIGAALGFGAGAAAGLGVVILALMLQTVFESQKSIASGIFTFGAVAIAAMFAANASFEGLLNWFSAFVPGRYEFDMSRALFEQLKIGWIWLIPTVIYASPLKLNAQRVIREKMNEIKNAYGTFRVLGAVWTVAVLLISAVSMIWTGGVV